MAWYTAASARLSSQKPAEPAIPGQAHHWVLKQSAERKRAPHARRPAPGQQGNESVVNPGPNNESRGVDIVRDNANVRCSAAQRLQDGVARQFLHIYVQIGVLFKKTSERSRKYAGQC